MDGFSKRAMNWFLSRTMEDQRWISELSPEPCTVYSSHQSLHPGRHPNSDPSPWRRNRLERARDFHEAGMIPQLVYKSKFPRIMGFHSPVLLSWEIPWHYPKAKTAMYSYKKEEIAKWPISNSEVTVLFSLMCLAGLQGFIDTVLWAPSQIEARAIQTSNGLTPFLWSSGDSHLLPWDWLKKKNLRKNRGVSKTHNGKSKYIVHINCVHTSLS